VRFTAQEGLSQSDAGCQHLCKQRFADTPVTSQHSGLPHGQQILPQPGARRWITLPLVEVDYLERGKAFNSGWSGVKWLEFSKILGRLSPARVACFTAELDHLGGGKSFVN
jgi:hypothetical protein